MPTGILNPKEAPDSFTLLELLVVIAIIAILAALTIGAAEAVFKEAGRNRTKGEIQAISSALEQYKTDNGIYATADFFGSTNAYVTVDPTGANYEDSSEALYQALSSKTNFTDPSVPGAKSYFAFKITQVGNATSGAGPSYVQDAFGYSYGYYTGDTNQPPQETPNNGAGFFDFWSTGGNLNTTTTNPTNSWISNWQQ